MNLFLRTQEAILVLAGKRVISPQPAKGQAPQFNDINETVALCHTKQEDLVHVQAQCPLCGEIMTSYITKAEAAAMDARFSCIGCGERWHGMMELERVSRQRKHFLRRR